MKFLIHIVFIVFPLLLSAQQDSISYTLQVIPLDKEADFLIQKEIKYQNTFQDEVTLQQTLKQLLSKLQSKTYIEASIDSLDIDKNNYRAFLYIGNQYEWTSLTNSNVESAFLEQIGFRERLYQNKPFYYQEVRQIQEKLLTYAENNGYPFASVKLDSVRVNDGQVSAQLSMEKHRLITIEDIKIEGDVKITKTYMANYLGIPIGSLYNQKKILEIKNRLRNLPFLSQTRNAIVTFRGDAATINLYLTKRRASKFDVLLGFLPRNTTQNPETSRKILLTATVDANAKNMLGLGETMLLKYQQLRPETQELNIELAYPYIFNLPFGIDGKLNLYKRDSSYLDLEYDIGIQYLFQGGNYLKAFWNRISTSLLSVDEARIVQFERLPENLDVSYANFGLEYSFQNLDYLFNPRKGWTTKIRGGAGFKTIKKNNSILELSSPQNPDFDFESLYDTLELKTFQYKIKGNVERYFPLSKRGVIKTAINSGVIISKNPIYINEHFRIGGNRLLRGFDEESIFSSLYVIGTLEYRFIIGTNSYLYLFGDYGYIENINVSDSPLGIGAGMTFETKVGVFGISYALGKQLENSFDFRSSKIHFGYVSYF